MKKPQSESNHDYSVNQAARKCYQAKVWIPREYRQAILDFARDLRKLHREKHPELYT